jgi:hypothetical protein
MLIDNARRAIHLQLTIHRVSVWAVEPIKIPGALAI